MKFIGIATLIIITLVSCVEIAYKFSVEGYLAGLIDKKSYHSEPGRDSVKYRKYIYEDSKELREKLEYHKKFMPVTSNCTEYIASVFDNFEG